MAKDLTYTVLKNREISKADEILMKHGFKLYQYICLFHKQIYC